jgi:transcription-repair coupling factor (superfamily II helicase)
MFDIIKLYPQGKVDLQKLLSRLLDFGYARVDFVASRGDFALRGDVLDIFAVGYGSPLRIELFSSNIETIATFDYVTGQRSDTLDYAVILPVRNKKSYIKNQKDISNFSISQSITNLLNLEPQDLVVHLDYGIGKFLGLVKLKDEREKFVLLEYAQKEKLYVPLSQRHLIQKYIGIGRKKPSLSKLGSKSWTQAKKRARIAVRSLALELLELHAKRKLFGGFAYSADCAWQKEFEKSFPYKETPDQIKSTQEVKEDMQKPYPMDRLLCGDVGYGKTEVAFRAAFKAVMDNKQVAILVPTTILAEQHYATFMSRIGKFPIRLEVLSRFRSHCEQKKTIEDLKSGKVDIVIGTHRLLSDDVGFKDLGLVIIDEEQRFGVEHKEKLKRLRCTVDVLTLTATPIPRTLYMSLVSLKDMSIINTPPQNRQSIYTFVLESDDEVIKLAIKRELQRQGQVYFVNNRILGINHLAQKIKKLIPEARVGVAHGQLPEKVLKRVMIDFVNKKIDVLVSTNIVESGLDIPNVNTIIVNRADNFGLSDLYQLRGRVGRFERKAFCYLLVPSEYFLSREAKKRLFIIERYTELGSGFDVAMEDLEIRGAGNLLGVEQHGHILAVGFDLYCKLLKDAVEQMRSQLMEWSENSQTLHYDLHRPEVSGLRKSSAY